MDTMTQIDPEVGTDRPLRSKRNTATLTFLGMVIVPTVFYFVYVAAIATHQYRSEFRIQIRSPSGNAMPSFGQLLGLTGASTPASDNGYAVTQYLESADAVSDLERAIGLRSRYQLSTADWFSRLPAKATREQLLRYWGRHIKSYFEPTTGTVVVQISAFSPADSLAITRGALQLSEALLNRMSNRARMDSVRYAKQEVAIAEQDLRTIDRRLLEVRNNAGIVDVSKQVSALMMRISELQQEVDRAQAEVTIRRRYLANGTPGREAAEARLSTLQGALAAARAAMASRSGGGSDSLADTVNIFDELDGQKLFTEKRLQAALASFNAAQNDAIRQQLYLDTIVEPSLPQEAAYPRPLVDTMQFFAFATAGWALLLILGLSVRDHIRA